MAITFTNGSTGLFDLLGKLFNLTNVANNFMGDTGTIGPDFNEVGLAYEAASLRKLITNLTANANTFYSASPALANSIFQTAQATIIELVNADVPQPDTGIQTALIELIYQMTIGIASVKKSHVASSYTPYNWNNGNGTMIISHKHTDGLINEYMFGEELVVTCVSDSQTGFKTAGNESFTIRGEYSIAGSTSYEYPMGSQCNTSISCIFGSGNNAYGNMLTNSSFQKFTLPNIPDNWLLTGTGFSQDSSAPYMGTNNLKVTSNGADSASIIQYFNDTIYTSATISPDTQYSVCLWNKVSTIPATGILSVRLRDDVGNTLKDRQGLANNFAKNLNSCSTGWVSVTGCFRTGRILPDNIGLEIKIDPPPPNGVNVSLDNIGMGLMTQLYAGGPWVSIHSGNSNYYEEDGGTITVTNDLAGKLGEWCDRAIGLKAYNYHLPSSDTPTIPDSVIS